LAAIQGGLATRVEEFQRALGAISAQVASLGRLASSTQADANTLATELSQHAESLSAVSQDLANQQQTLDSAFERRQSGIQALIGDLSGRSEAFDGVLSRFATTVEENFARAQARAQEISAALAAATRGASVAVAGQFETVRDTAAKERERTAQALQAAIDGTNAQLTNALDHAAERFRQSVAEVKDMASQVQRDLDATRQELRRGVLELPQETSETAEAMRRVVADQIRALKELAALVSDAGAAYDVAEPAAIVPAVAAAGMTAVHYEKSAGRTGESPRQIEARSLPDGAVARGGGPTLVAEATPFPDVDSRPGTETAKPARPQPPSWPAARATGPTSAPAKAASPVPGDRAQAGWLSNLLAAASRDDEPDDADIANGTDTLEALTQGIGGLIDNAAAVEMWDRWRRGDAAAVSRRLYTEAGQQAFDEIRRRYRSDAQFRDSATRYTQEFERLLAKVSQNDRDGSQWRSYLLSNTGKVYTILAHASGRLG
jgi:hypothetical protein